MNSKPTTSMTPPVEERIIQWINTHWSIIKVFFIVFAINLIIYGQKIVHYSLPADDYMRYYGDDNTRLLITTSARWGQALLNDHVFTSSLQIMPYLHGIVGIFSFTLMGFMTLFYFKYSKPFELIIGSLLISATPMFAHNLFFSTNITAWITLALGLYGFILSYHYSIKIKILGFIFLVFSIGNYQTIIQVTSIMILFRVLFQLLDIKSFKNMQKIFFDASISMLFILFAYLTSNLINELFLDYYGWTSFQRLAQATQGHGIYIYVQRIVSLYGSIIEFHHFKLTFHYLYAVSAFFAFISLIHIHNSDTKTSSLKIVSLFLITILFFSLPILINLPLILGVDIPLRAHFSIGWVLAGFFLLQMRITVSIIKSISILLALIILVVNIYYISLFFDAGIRQTTADIRRANLIVERIRMHPNYSQEPLQLKIIGGQKYNVLGWDMKYEQPFITHLAQYKIFKYFSDLAFTEMSSEVWEEEKRKLIQEEDIISNYPHKDAIIIKGTKVFLFLEASSVNYRINIRKYFKEVEHIKADIQEEYTIYLHKKTLLYEKYPCTKKDIEAKFFLRLYPYTEELNNNDAPHFTRDFTFIYHGEKVNNICRAIIDIPQFHTGRIRTGQFERGKKIFWEANIYKTK